MNYRQHTDKEFAKKVFQAFSKVYNNRGTRQRIRLADYKEKRGLKDTLKYLYRYGKIRQVTRLDLKELHETSPSARKLKNRLKKSEDQYRLLADNINRARMAHGFKHKKKTIYVSPSVEKMYGYTSDEINKDLFEENSHGKNLFRKCGTRFQLFEMPKALVNPLPYVHTYSLELQACHKDGHLLWIENTLSIIRDENRKPAINAG